MSPSVPFRWNLRPGSLPGLLLALFGALAADCAAQQPAVAGADPPSSGPATASESPDRAEGGEPVSGAAEGDRTRLNLLGEIDSDSGEARRNENVRLTLIDNNVLKELLRRMGATATIIEGFPAERSFFGLEYGGSPKPSLHLPKTAGRAVRGELFWSHQNSALSARSFFQAGDVRPARTNDYGLNLGTPLGSGTALTVQLSQRKMLGQVNGNVLVPAADERVPTTTDPAKRALVQRIIGAYPSELPNRTDINERALNTNAPQQINNDRASAVLDSGLGESRLTLRYNVTLQHVEAFQLVGGQNPDTTTKNHGARSTWSRSFSPYTDVDLTAGYERIGSLLVPEETSLGPFFLFSRILQSIGPSSSMPIDRVQNLFRAGGRLAMRARNHNLTAGFETLRKQVNGFESNNHRGTFSFRADFGRNAVENLLAGEPSQYRFAVGNAHRGFRNSSMLAYLHDSWKVRPDLTLQVGLRFEPVGRPTEVDHLSEVAYGADWNNIAPSLGLAYRPRWGLGVLRGAYGLHYGQLFNTTFMQSRFNTPGVLSLVVNAADLIDPLRDLSPSDLDPTARSIRYSLDPELSTPYSHQYNFSWTLEPVKGTALEVGYVGSRSHRLLNQRYTNRARPVDGIRQITRTINLRRPDPRYFDVLHVVNGSIGYFDAAKATFRVLNRAGLNLDASYWFSKAIDLGSDYTNTAVGRDGRLARSPVELDVWGYMKGVSEYHQPHATLLRLSYAIPARHHLPPGLRRIFSGWQLSSVVLWKSGTPFGIRAGSDSPGIGNVDGAGSDRPNVLDASVLGRTVDHPDRSAALLPKSAFKFIQPTDTGGNLGRNTFRKDSVWNVNTALSRRILLPKKRSLLFRAESLNALNHPQFAEPDINLASRTFGAITNTLNDGRAFRFTLRIEF